MPQKPTPYPNPNPFDQFYQNGGYNHNKTSDTFQRFYWTRQKKVALWFNPYLHGQVLDLGCGEGELSRFIPAKKLVLSDISTTALTKARAYSPYVITADSSFLPFSNHSFDTVLFTEVIYHLPQPSETLNEIYRVLRPGGFCIFTAGIKNSLSLRFRETLNKWSHQTPQHTYGIFFSYYSSQEISHMFKLSGFNILSRIPYFFQFQPFLDKPYQEKNYQLLEKIGGLFPLFCRYIFILATKPQ